MSASAPNNNDDSTYAKDAMNDRKAAYDAGTLSTTDGKTPVTFDGPAPNPETDARGQHAAYWVLSETERAKGFVRPVRSSYRHVGPPGPAHPLRDLSEDEQRDFAGEGYVKYEMYPAELSPLVGRYWSQADLDRVGKGCGTVTTMGRALAETYAARPSFYGSTMCVSCGTHLPWDGSDERVGT
jgi:hypothetical protein